MKTRPFAVSLFSAIFLAACGTQAQAPAAPATSAPASAAASAPASTAPAASPGGQPIKVKVATQHVATDAPLYIASEKGYFKEQGLDIQFNDVNGGTDTLPLVVSGQLDVAVGSISSGLYNAVARNMGVKLVSTKGASPLQPNLSKPATAIVLSKQAATTIKDYKDLKGKNVAISEHGNGLEIELDHILQRGGLTLNDVDIKTLTFPATLPALANGSIDASMELQPWITQGRAKNILTVWHDLAEFSPGNQANALVYGPTMQQLGDAGNRFMVAYTKAMRYYTDATGPKHANWEEFVQIMTKNTSLKDPALYDQVGWNYMNPNCSLNVASMNDSLDWYAAHGYVKTKPDLKAAVDDSYCQYALKQLGQYS